MEDEFGLVVVMVVDYAAVLLSYKDRRYFLEAPVIEGYWRLHGLNAMEGAVKSSD